MGQYGAVLIPALVPAGPSSGSPIVISVRGARVFVAEPSSWEGVGGEGALFVGTLDGRHVWAVDENHADAVDERFVDLMTLYGGVAEPVWAAAGRAVQLIDWNRNHRYCGRCGKPTEVLSGERARRCSDCGLSAFPRLAPAIITLVHRDDGRALLARNARWPTAMYSCLAGFVEPGESVEDAVRREVQEEVGIKVTDLRYFGSQPWPFPHSLMLGFHARYLDGDLQVDGDEIAEARWFEAGELPDIPGPISIARQLIDDWAKG